jgi:hypothetical protein
MPRRFANSNARARVSKDEDGRGGGPHASRRIAAPPSLWKRLYSLALRCFSA